MNDHAHHHHHHHEGHGFDTPEGAARAELDGEVLGPITAQAAASTAELAAEAGIDVARVLDLGSGPGVGTVHLAAVFPDAEIVAVDASEAMLERVIARAGTPESAARITTRRAEFPDGLTELEPADVVWASMAMHHVGNQGEALEKIRGLVRPGGVVALVETGGPTRILPDGDDLGRPGLWDRIDDAWHRWFQSMRAELPGAVEGDDYESLLATAGFTPRSASIIDVHHEAPLVRQVRDYVEMWASGMVEQLESFADPEDLARISAFASDTSSSGIGRTDLRYSGSRTLYLATVPT